MPSSGYPIVDLLGDEMAASGRARRLVERAKLAMAHGLFVEWMESFVGAWEATKDVDVASMAGLDEWDM